MKYEDLGYRERRKYNIMGKTIRDLSNLCPISQETNNPAVMAVINISYIGVEYYVFGFDRYLLTFDAFMVDNYEGYKRMTFDLHSLFRELPIEMFDEDRTVDVENDYEVIGLRLTELCYYLENDTIWSDIDKMDDINQFDIFLKHHVCIKQLGDEKVCQMHIRSENRAYEFFIYGYDSRCKRLFTYEKGNVCGNKYAREMNLSLKRLFRDYDNSFTILHYSEYLGEEMNKIMKEIKNGL